jgi:hypothetical protein
MFRLSGKRSIRAARRKAVKATRSILRIKRVPLVVGNLLLANMLVSAFI